MKKTKLMSLTECKIVDLPRINDPRGNLTFIEGIASSRTRGLASG